MASAMAPAKTPISVPVIRSPFMDEAHPKLLFGIDPMSAQKAQ